MYNIKDYQFASSKILKYVPRGTLEKLEAFVVLTLKWNEKINLISRRSEEFIWSEHVLDSIQALSYLVAPETVLMDVGSGAGFPGLVLSLATGWKTILVERNQKKCAFLKEAQLVTGANIIVENKPVEELRTYKPSTIFSRGVSSVRVFLHSISHLIHKDLQMITWKGNTYKNEVEEARHNIWNFEANFKHSSDMRGTLVLLSNFRRT